ncbi:MAG: type II secretion system F family protein [Anaerolineae bacterium]|jgi:tight adherence protein C|nr:type II secretion system F family protein [Anaerolineae bacterium]MBT3712951.1 type II secretion system F family protein [Anaerolineae bacterium]MBT4309444.1 type II secretion system F family protein [Anaerolineae bacterium]MBT4458280.1 type II secretion system F family protein [Anaerolineae bacterium]MBT4840965.1 type II secretion system F family protein [Anaerolineae bacterium]
MENIPWAWIIIGFIVVGGVIALVVAGQREASSEEDDLLASRLVEFSERGEVASLEEIELSQPFRERVILPILLRVGELSARFTPQHLIEDTELKIELAGNPIRAGASTFLASRFVIAGVLGSFLTIIFTFAPQSGTMENINPYIVVPLFTVIGFFFPQLWLQSKIDRRQKEIQKAMPDALDLLTICVEAGLGFDAAMSKVSEKWDNELSLSFARAIREVQLGKLRRDALKDMSDRIGIAEMTSFIAAVIQSEQLGVSMAKVLRIQSEQMRIKRRQRAEEEAHKAPVKMIIPMAFLTFPSIFIVLLAPAAFSMMENFVGQGIGG